MDTFRDIVNTYSAQVYNHALKLLKNQEDAEEATQDVFMKINKAIDLFRGDAKLSTWIWRITTNVCYTRLSKKRLETTPLDETTMTVPDMVSTVAELTNNERKDLIETALIHIPQQQASILLLFYFEEKSYKEIADIFNLPEGTVATLLHRGRENLKSELFKSRKEFL